MNFEITDTIHETDEKYIFEGLLEYNLERIEDKNPRDLGIAPLFYKKHGYREVFTLENYPVTGKRYYFTKNL